MLFLASGGGENMDKSHESNIWRLFYGIIYKYDWLDQPYFWDIVYYHLPIATARRRVYMQCLNIFAITLVASNMSILSILVSTKNRIYNVWCSFVDIWYRRLVFQQKFFAGKHLKLSFWFQEMYVKCGRPVPDYKKNSLYENPDINLVQRTWDLHISAITEKVLVNRAPAVAIDFISSIEMQPENWLDNYPR